MKIAYADPPYIGLAHYYEENEEVDHLELIQRMCKEYDGWALSLHTPSLKKILNYCPDNVRIGSWVKPFCSFKPGVNPAYAWEPVVFWGGRSRTRKQETVRDWVAENITLRRGMKGAKPRAVCWWIFEFLGMEPSDEFIDLFPGTGAVSLAWETWCEMKLEKQMGFCCKPNQSFKTDKVGRPTANKRP